MHTCLCMPAATTLYIPMLQPMSEEEDQPIIGSHHTMLPEAHFQVQNRQGDGNSPRRTASGYFLSARTTFLTMPVSQPPCLLHGMEQQKFYNLLSMIEMSADVLR